MAATESYMLPLQTKAPDFSLTNVVSGKVENLNQLKGKSGTLVVFICNHCPYVVHLIGALIETAKEFSKKGVNTIAISSNSTTSHPEDGPKKMKILALEKNSLSHIYLTKLRRLPIYIKQPALLIFICLTVI